METILITGCSAGFGKITALTLAEKGYKVLAGIRNTESDNKTVTEEMAKVQNIKVVDLDLSSSDSIAAAVDSLGDTNIDILINNAGVCGIGFAEMHEVDKLKKIFEVNVFGMYDLTRQIIPKMRQQKSGLIISVTSIVGRIVMPIWGAYSASKYAMEALAETWRYELMPLGIDSVIVEPGPHPTTSMGGKMGPLSAAMPEMDVMMQYGPVAQSLQTFQEELQKELAQGTYQKPEGVAKAILEIIEMPAGKRPTRTVVDRNLNEMLTGLNNFTDNMYQQMYAQANN